MTEKKAKSPYQRYGKTPYRYSADYYAWRAAAIRGDKNEAERIGRVHSRKFISHDYLSGDALRGEAA